MEPKDVTLPKSWPFPQIDQVDLDHDKESVKTDKIKGAK